MTSSHNGHDPELMTVGQERNNSGVHWGSPHQSLSPLLEIFLGKELKIRDVPPPCDQLVAIIYPLLAQP
jgi:hypothetical protein